MKQEKFILCIEFNDDYQVVAKLLLAEVGIAGMVVVVVEDLHLVHIVVDLLEVYTEAEGMGIHFVGYCTWFP